MTKVVFGFCEPLELDELEELEELELLLEELDDDELDVAVSPPHAAKPTDNIAKHINLFILIRIAPNSGVKKAFFDFFIIKSGVLRLRV